jgi:molybdopterin converting factor small subunit
MRVKVSFYSYFKDQSGCAHASETLTDGSTLGDLLQQIQKRFPKLAGMKNSTLMAVGLEYQRADYVLQEGDEVSLFPPVQGG